MEKEYYFLENNQQKGPFTLEELKSCSIKLDTAIWTVDFENWKQAKDVEELQDILKKSPPPPPVFGNGINCANSYDNKVLTKFNKLNKNIKIWTSLKLLFLFILITSVSILGAYVFIILKEKFLYEDMINQWDKLFNGKEKIIGGVYDQFHDIPENNDSIIFDRENSNKETIIMILHNDTKEIKDLYYNLEIIYLRPSNPNISINSFNQNVYEIFSSFFTTDELNNRKKLHYNCWDINDLIKYKNDYYSYYSHLQETENNPSQYQNEKGDILIENEKYWLLMSSSSDEEVNFDKKLSLSISLGSILLLLLIIGILKPTYFRNLNLFSKKWQNVFNPEQVFCVKHSFFNKHLFLITFNNVVTQHGMLKITDRGKILVLMNSNNQLKYKIKNLTKDELTLISLQDKSIITFERNKD